MTYRKLAIVPLLAAAAGAFAFTIPASADTGITPVTFSVGGGGLSITVPNGPVDLGTALVSTSPQSVSAQLGVVSVTDDRGTTAGWTVTASATDVTGPQTISVSAPGSSSYTTPGAVVFGTATVTASNLPALYPPAPVQVATGVDGVNTASWNPTIQITVPADALAGTYGTSVTHSVA